MIILIICKGFVAAIRSVSLTWLLIAVLCVHERRMAAEPAASDKTVMKDKWKRKDWERERVRGFETRGLK